MFTALFDNRLALAPINMNPVHDVLDIATGTGVWAIEFGK
jgi:ubiquinone/menaquinone biosynthesis C-methylase UbiE